MARHKSISNAELVWDGDASAPDAPRSRQFDDIYFAGDGREEALHVFIKGNDLPARFENAGSFAIGELGFGAGLNFLTAWDVWRKTETPPGARLNFFSVEAFPFSDSDLARAHEAWPEFADLSEILRAALPPPCRGFHRMELDKDATLTLYYGDAAQGLAGADGVIDAWFLDGFAPSKNPDMWSPALFAQAARLSRGNTTIASFTVAGAVRRALDEAGFAVEKAPGFGRKRHMLVGKRNEEISAPKIRAPWFDCRKTSGLGAGASVAVIGAGIAGASLAHALGRAGFKPVIFEAARIASGASGNPAGLIMPRLDVDDMPEGRFHLQAYLYTLGLIRSVEQQTKRQLFHPCGALRHGANEREKLRQTKLFAAPPLPPEWMEAHEEGLLFPQGGVIDPAAFVRALIADTPVTVAKADRLTKKDAKWIVETNGETSGPFDAVVIANGLDALKFQQTRSLPLAGSAGQVDWFKDEDAPKRAHIFGAYAAPVPPFDGSGGLIIGATYSPISNDGAPQTLEEATQSNINAVRQYLPHRADRLTPAASAPRASVRCVTPDYLPIVGPVPDWGFYSGAYDGLRHGRKKQYPAGESVKGLYILTALGSRGLVTAPLAAAAIACEMTGAPAPIDVQVAEALHPARFFIRDLKRTPPDP